jgi:hypothetical protein
MQLLIAIELALMLVLVLKVSIGNIERELKRNPFRPTTPLERYDANWPT